MTDLLNSKDAPPLMLAILGVIALLLALMTGNTRSKLAFGLAAMSLFGVAIWWHLRPG
jgi:hypothetical protein